MSGPSIEQGISLRAESDQGGEQHRRLRGAPGGKGANQAAAAARAGAKTAMGGCVGADGFAALAVDTMRNSGVETNAVATVDAPTACAAISVDKDCENSIVVASGATRACRGNLD